MSNSVGLQVIRDARPSVVATRRAPRGARPILLTFVLATAAVGIVTRIGERAACATSYTITVDASNKTTGMPRFWSEAVGTGTASLTLRSDLETHYKLGNRELGFQRVRGHGVLNDDIGIYKAAGSYNWTNFDKYLTSIVSAGMRPVMELDFMPTALALTGSSRDTYKDVTAYKQFIQAVVQHCVDKYGATDVGQWYWEIWNEPDYTGFWNGTNASEATSAKMTDYYALYDNAVSAITAVLPNALVGGPATTGPGPVAAFLQHCKSAGTRVTFASSHSYPGGAAGASANAANLVSDNNTRVSGITSGGYTTATVKSFNSEWNSSYSGQGGGVGDDLTSMDNNWNVGFILKAVKLLSDKNSGSTPPLDLFSYWVLSDVFDESSGPSGSYILGKNGTLPFGQVFGLMTFQGVRKAAFNAFKMLNALGPTRLMSSGGTSSDGVDAVATLSASGDEIEILVYDNYTTLNTTGTDSVTVTVSNLPAALAGKQVFVTQFVADETHSNPYSVWTTQGKPTNPTEVQWQAMKAAQHLALLQPVSTTTPTTGYTATFTMNRQAGTLLVLGVNRPVTGRNGLVTMEGEDYDGQSGVTKEDSNDVDLGQSVLGNSGSSLFYDVVDMSDAGVGAVQMRVNAQTATNLEFHADSQTGTLLGQCAVAATSSAWATQTCTLAQTAGVHTLYVVFDGTVHLNWILFQKASGGTGTGGSGAGGTTGAAGAGGAGGKVGTGGSGATGTGGTTGGGGRGTGGSVVTGTGGSGSGGAGTTGTGGTGTTGSGGTGATGAGGSGTTGAGGTGTTGSGGLGSGGSTSGTGGSSASGGSSAASSGGGCACTVGDASGPSGTPFLGGLLAAVLGLRRRRERRGK